MKIQGDSAMVWNVYRQGWGTYYRWQGGVPDSILATLPEQDRQALIAWAR